MIRWIAAAWISLLIASSAFAQIPALVSERPPSNGPTPVKAGVYYIDISEINGATETFSATAYLSLEWNDPRLRFETKDPGKVAFYKPDTIWTPAVEIINAEKVDDQIPPTCAVTSDGTVYYSRRVVVLLNTQLDLRNFPFDRQKLDFIVESSRYGSQDVIFMPDPDQSGMGKDIVSRGWNYSAFRWEIRNQPFANTQQSYSRIVFDFAAQRNASFFIWKVVFPTVIFVFLTWTIFWIPVHEVQTALLVSITVLLTAVAFGNVTDTLLPMLGYRTWLDQFQLGSFLFIVSTVVETITVFGIHLRGEASRAEKVRKFLRAAYPCAYALFCVVLLTFAFL